MMIIDLIGMLLFNLLLLDEGMVVVEVMMMCFVLNCGKKLKFYVSNKCYS